MKRFKVGDKVVIKKDFEEYYKYNKKTSSRDIHTITRVGCSPIHKYHYMVNGWWFPDEGYAGAREIIGGKVCVG